MPVREDVSDILLVNKNSVDPSNDLDLKIMLLWEPHLQGEKSIIVI